MSETLPSPEIPDYEAIVMQFLEEVRDNWTGYGCKLWFTQVLDGNREIEWSSSELNLLRRVDEDDNRL
jgi:hypothetical protein